MGPLSQSSAETVKRMVAYAVRTASPLAALALALDDFKQINGTYGHGSADEVLAAVGSTLTTSIRESDFVGHAGGEEFLLLLPDTDVQGALHVAEKVRTAVRAIAIAPIEQRITASIGVAVLPDHARDATSLLRHADRALDAAKKHGRDRTEVFGRDVVARGVMIDLAAATPFA
jgi:diguanylate cyclase (GGDEF)-like protein